MSHLLVEHDGPLTTLTLDDPARRNALSVQLLQQLSDALDDTAQREESTAVLLRGNGPAFCSGFDLGPVVEEPMVLQDLLVALGNVTRRMRTHPLPVILAAHGAAIAGGCALLSAADLVVLGNQTMIGYPVHRLGLSPAVTLPTLMPSAGEGTARMLVMDGRLRSGEEIHRLGLGTRLVCETDVQDEARQLAEDIAAQPAQATRATKKWLCSLEGSDDAARWEEATSSSEPLVGGEEVVKRLQAFWSKRQS